MLATSAIQLGSRGCTMYLPCSSENVSSCSGSTGSSSRGMKTRMMRTSCSPWRFVALAQFMRLMSTSPVARAINSSTKSRSRIGNCDASRPRTVRGVSRRRTSVVTSAETTRGMSAGYQSTMPNRSPKSERASAGASSHSSMKGEMLVKIRSRLTDVSPLSTSPYSFTQRFTDMPPASLPTGVACFFSRRRPVSKSATTGCRRMFSSITLTQCSSAVRRGSRGSSRRTFKSSLMRACRNGVTCDMTRMSPVVAFAAMARASSIVGAARIARKRFFQNLSSEKP
mmetsp:Transcript_41664/g.128734  ORF Transcript_41664/g.128734 Transcript_41664/m.128734 type:complete len:283 (+) Transcript_41664:728-1576(+)